MITQGIETKYKSLIREKYTALTESCRNVFSDDDRQFIQHAFETATAIREERKNNLTEADYQGIVKMLDIAFILTSEIGLGRISVVCEMLHSKVEQGILSRETVEKDFGSKVAQILKGLKEISNIYATHKIIDSENFRKLLLSFAEDVRVQLIFLAEKLYELRTADDLNEDAQKRLVDETNYIYIPFAHRLGLYNIKSEMEDRALRYSNPQKYAEIEQKLANTKDEREKYIAEFIKPIVAELEKRGIKFKVKYRTKTIASILNKIRKQQVEFEEIRDIFAVRFIIDSTGEDEKPDCWRVYSIVADKYVPNPKRLRDWISRPKSNGYESLQTTVLGYEKKWVEVQIRTERMDDIAERGYAAHWRYKGGSSDTMIENWLSDLREVLESSESSAIDLLDDLQLNIHDKEVYVFTPKGDLLTLPAGATLLDFAYAIHSNVGDKCTGGSVNQMNKTLHYVLQNGDQLTIKTSANQHPKADWLKIAITTKARNKIRQYLNENVNKQADLGKEILLRKLKNWKLEYNDELIRILMHHFKCKFALDLYQGIAEDRFDVTEIKELLTVPVEDTKSASEAENKGPDEPKPQKVGEDVLIIDKHVDNVIYKFARCCNPAYGDDIVGFVSIGNGIKVHRQDCKNLCNLKEHYPYRIVTTRWTNRENT
ncbi:GTP pyrophosphokinase [Bacteroidia bacterium]|nr:GTP pyrophosphokinase [Bacteroidia bacterium]